MNALSEEGTARRPDGSRLLVVEDDAVVARDVKRTLESMGYEVVDTVRKGEWAVNAAREHRPDLVLMDIRLAGDMDGVEAAGTILEELGVPVVYLTAFADEETRTRVRETTPFGYVVKPFTERELKTTVEVALVRHRMEKKLQAERAELSERVKEQSCLYDVLRILHDEARELDERLQAVVDRIPAGWKHPGVTVARLELEGRTYRSERFSPPTRSLRAPIEFHGETVGEIEVGYLEERPDEDIGPFLVEERRLLDEISDRTADELESTEIQRRFRQMAETIEEVFWLRDPANEEMLYVSPAFETIWGRSVEELYEDPQVWIEAIHPDDRDRIVDRLLRDRAPDFEAEYRIVRPDGEVRWIRDRGFPVVDEDGTVYRVAGVAEDVTEERRARRESERQKRTLSRILDTAAEGILLTDAEGNFEYANPAAEEILGLEPGAIDQRSYRDPRWEICGPDGGPFSEERLPVARVLRNGEAVMGVEHGVMRPDGTRIVLSVNAKPLNDADGRLTGVVASVRDVTEQKRFEAELQRRALHDYLTDLPNRALFRDRLDHALARADRHGERLAVLFVDLKRFKVVNDSLGHDAGDLVLREVARRLAGAIREQDTVARAGGDEFTVLLEGVADEQTAVEVAERLAQVFQAPVSVDGREVPMEASIGVALHGGGAGLEVSGSELIRRADAAMYRAKELPGTRCAVADPQADASQPARLEREARLRQALEEGRIQTFYQPIYSLATGHIRGVEALARWHEPDLGDVSPGAFIPLAEETGLIISLGEQQLERACRQLQEEGYAGGATGEPLRLHVNLSARQLEDPDVVGRTSKILERTGFPPSRLCLEITESAAMRKPEAVEQLKEIGVDLAIDDFGTRYSTLSQLRRLRVDALKIDRTFIDGLPEDRRDRAIVETILTLGRTLEMDIVAEGIEREDQLELLRSLNCDEAQGFHLARPQPAEELRELLMREADARGRPEGPEAPGA
jgi:diguanylate cyclase (GGDEF)-like protein/PAS domain S-box-containing protein